MTEQREYPRIRRSLRVAFELVRWNERDLDEVKSPTELGSYDISASGIRLEGPPPFTRRDLGRLNRGVQKTRMAIHLDDASPPVLTFARLIWTSGSSAARCPLFGRLKGKGRAPVQLGFNFIEVRGPVFDTLLTYVGERLGP